MTILSSASKLVFVIMAVALCVLTFMGKIEAKDFITLAAMAFSAYFSRDKGASADVPTTEQLG